MHVWKEVRHWQERGIGMGSDKYLAACNERAESDTVNCQIEVCLFCKQSALCQFAVIIESPKTMSGAFPPSSAVNELSFWPAIAPIALPAPVLPCRDGQRKSTPRSQASYSDVDLVNKRVLDQRLSRS